MIRLKSIPNLLNDITEPQHPCYHPIQATLFAGLSYVGIAYLTSISPIHGMALAVSAYAINQLTTPLFAQIFKPSRDLSLASLIGQVTQLTISFILAKTVCQLAEIAFSFKEVRLMGVVFLTSLYMSKLALLKFRQQLNKT